VPYKEHEPVVLRKDHPEHGLKAGDVGGVVLVLPDGTYEVEFVDSEGRTVALLTLREHEIAPFQGRALLRALNPAV